MPLLTVATVVSTLLLLLFSLSCRRCCSPCLSAAAAFCPVFTLSYLLLSMLSEQSLLMVFCLVSIELLSVTIENLL